MRLVLVFLALLALISAWGWSSRADAAVLPRQRAEAARMLPAFVLSAMAGLGSGLARRERVRRGAGGHSSPLRAWIGKRAAIAGLLLPAAWLCAPLPFSGAWLWAAGAALAAGLRLYAGHLPTKL